MKIGFIGLGKMGRLIITRLLEEGIDVVGYNRSKDKIEEFNLKFKTQKTTQFKIKNYGSFSPTYSLYTLTNQLHLPRIIWLMITHQAVDEVLSQIVPFLSRGDIIIDGGNSYYKDSIRRCKELKKKGIDFLDVGTSGGIEGTKNGLCFMVGGEEGSYKRVQSILNLLSKPNGSSTYFGPSGAGHFVKMVHNGIEYAMLQAIGEGFSVLAGSRQYVINLAKAAESWEKGSIIRGYLIELSKRAFGKDHRLTSIAGVVGGGETGEWTVKTAKEAGIKVPVIETSLKERQKTHKKPSFAGKVVAILRHEFGGHPVVKK